MNKSELIDAIASKAGIAKGDAKKALDAFTATIAEEMKKGEKVALVGFGTFSVVEKSARTGINPATKAKIEIAAKKVTKFKPGAELEL
jgi:DNA-binding protein HU-beta